ncbi:MAG: hypothetical protein KBF12_02595 [Sebaldella sp.]|nr:hypothetical protein [Sebaldella sp.]
MDKGRGIIMEIIAKIPNFKTDLQRLKESYYARYGVMDENYAKEIDDTISDSMRDYEIEFYKDKFLVRNIVKNEVNSHLYSELYRVEKIKEGYLFSLDKTKFYFFKFSDLVENESTGDKLDEILKKYYTGTTNGVIATIENYVLDQKRCITGLKAMYKNMLSGMQLAGLIFLGVFQYLIYRDIFITVISVIGYVILIFILFKFFYYKRTAKKILKSINENFLSARILFYPDEIEIITKKKLTLIRLKYEEFYKIQKIKEGYMFYTQKFSFYFFGFDEFKKEELEELEKILSKYSSRKKKS